LNEEEIKERKRIQGQGIIYTSFDQQEFPLVDDIVLQK
jgi:hypothetical protein